MRSQQLSIRGRNDPLLESSIDNRFYVLFVFFENPVGLLRCM